MCRIFGFKSVIDSQVHRSLISADNALGTQSMAHPDGWGVAYYVSGAPHLIKSAKTALEDQLFKKVSGVVSSQTVLAHIRKATSGEKNLLNTHPFQYGNWVFAHNGHIADFEKHKDQLTNEIAANLRRFILGETDSEVIFYFLLSRLAKAIDLEKKSQNIKDIKAIVSKSLEDLSALVGPFHATDEEDHRDKNYWTFLLSNGESMIAYHGGKTLYYSTYKNKCMDRDSCPHFATECEAPSLSGFVNHLIFSSEPLSGENIWLKMRPGEMIGVDSSMQIEKL